MEIGKKTGTIGIRWRKIGRAMALRPCKLCRDELNVHQPWLTLRSSGFIQPLFASLPFFFSYSTDRVIDDETDVAACGTVSQEDEPVAIPSAFSRAQTCFFFNPQMDRIIEV